VRGLDRATILAAFGKRVAHSAKTEFATALGEVHKIARLRLEQLLAE
ncbi:MAG: OHCU decarboxylase, partial [Alphaproteobacteria bacterium]|nr:OHCU decarboxylase [Alphaproteobacteria bacterium]